MKVNNMLSPRSGRPVANQYIVETTEQDPFDGTQMSVEYFQSYQSIIAKKAYTSKGLKITLDTHYWDYSVTTGRYRNEFLGEGITETRKKIESGEYELADFN